MAKKLQKMQIYFPLDNFKQILHLVLFVHFSQNNIIILGIYLPSPPPRQHCICFLKVDYFSRSVGQYRRMVLLTTWN